MHGNIRIRMYHSEAECFVFLTNIYYHALHIIIK